MLAHLTKTLPYKLKGGIGRSPLAAQDFFYTNFRVEKRHDGEVALSGRCLPLVQWQGASAAFLSRRQRFGLGIGFGLRFAIFGTAGLNLSQPFEMRTSSRSTAATTRQAANIPRTQSIAFRPFKLSSACMGHTSQCG